MGVLYYFARKDDPNRELFALNKLYRYTNCEISDLFRGDDPFEKVYRLLTDLGSTPEVFAQRFFFSDEKSQAWGRRVFQRLQVWAGTSELRLLSEHNLDSYHYEEHEALIIGSAYDQDYQDDGMTYIPGSGF